MGKWINIEFTLLDYHPLETFLKGAWDCAHFQPVGLVAQCSSADSKARHYFLAGAGWPIPAPPDSLGRALGKVVLQSDTDEDLADYLRKVQSYLAGEEKQVSLCSKHFENDRHVMFANIAPLPASEIRQCDQSLGSLCPMMGSIAGAFNVQTLEKGDLRWKRAFAGVRTTAADPVAPFVSLHFSRFNDGGRRSRLSLSAHTQVWLGSGRLVGDLVDTSAADINLQRLLDLSICLREGIDAPLNQVLLRLDGPEFLREEQRIESFLRPLGAVRDQ